MRFSSHIKTLLICLGCTSQAIYAADPEIKVADFSDFRQTWAAVGALQFNSSLCVGIENATIYRVTITGSGSGGSFTLQNNSGDSINYSVEWANQTGQTTGSFVSSGLPITGLASSTSSDCQSSNASLIVKITEAELQSALSGVHSGTLSVLVAPE
jgi:hypothetical protein